MSLINNRGVRMKISTKGRYDLTILIELSQEVAGWPLAFKSKADHNSLSVHYLEQLESPMRNAGLIKSVRGAYGGYKLAKEPSVIKAGDIIRVLEGPIVLVEGIEDEEPSQQALWIRITEAVKGVLDTTTLEDIMNHEKNEPQEEYMFYI